MTGLLIVGLEAATGAAMIGGGCFAIDECFHMIDKFIKKH